MIKPFKKPPTLKKGDVISLIAPAGYVKDVKHIDFGIQLAESWGLKVVLGKHIYQKNNHFAGFDEERLEDLQLALDDETIKAIWCIRGGYGTVRIIDKVNFEKFKKNPKWIIGFSDITVLHNTIHNLGFQSLHGLMPATVADASENKDKSIQSLKDALFGNELSYKINSSKFNRLGSCSGILTGGNLSILASLLGSKSSINTTGCILFIEEVGEYLYHIDRMLQNLKRNGYFKNCSGLLVGRFTDIKKNDPSFGKTIEELILDVVAEYNFPVLFNFPAGHSSKNETLILGSKVMLDVREKDKCYLLI